MSSCILDTCSIQWTAANNEPTLGSPPPATLDTRRGSSSQTYTAIIYFLKIKLKESLLIARVHIGSSGESLDTRAGAVMDPVSQASGSFLPLSILKRKIDLTSDG